MSNGNKAGSSKVLLRMGNVKYRMTGPGKSPVGTLTIYEERVEWSCKEVPDNLVIHFSKIRVQRISPPNKPKVQLQILMNGEDQATFVFMNVKTDQKGLIEERDKVKEALQSALGAYRQKAHKAMAKIEETGSNEMKEKQKILGENSLLLQIYINLVKEKLITPQEFWSLHYNSNETDMEEQSGVSAGFLSSLIQSAEGANGINLRVTPELITTIFRTYPTVKRKHIELVPHEMDEKEFWAKFFQSHYFHRERVAEVNAKDPFSDCIKMDENDMQDIIQKGESNLKRTLNLGNLADDFGIFSDMRLHQISMKTNAARTSLVRRCNYHSERILSTTRVQPPSLTTADTPQEQQEENEIGRDQQNGLGTEPFDLDLESHELSEFQCEQELPAVNIDLQSTNFDIAQSKYPQEKALGYRTTIADLASQTILNEDIATTYYDSLFEENSADDEEMDVNGTTDEKSLFAGIDKDNVEKIRIVHECVAELLKHFWSSCPPSNPEMEAKMQKMIKTLEIFENSKLNECERKYGSRYVEHCKEMLKRARTTYNNYMAARS